MVELSRWAADVLQDYRAGKLIAQFSYDEFLNEVRKIPRGTDFSRIAQDLAASKSLNSIKPSKDESPSSSSSEKKTVQTKLVPVKSKGNDEYKGWTVAQLQKECVECGLPKTGKKADLIERLNGPRPPKAWLERKKKGYYVPKRYNTCATALLVGLFLEQRKDETGWKGMTKEELYSLAEGLNISKDPFSGVATGPFKYDGWSSMSDLRSSEIPLVVLKKRALQTDYKLRCCWLSTC